MLTIAPDLKLFRQFNQQFYRLFERDISKLCARSRRARLVNHAPYQANAFLAKALKKLSKDKFNHMIVFLGYVWSTCNFSRRVNAYNGWRTRLTISPTMDRLTRPPRAC